MKKNITKRIILILAAVFVLTTSLSACTSSGSQQGENSQQKSTTSQNETTNQQASTENTQNESTTEGTTPGNNQGTKPDQGDAGQGQPSNPSGLSTKDIKVKALYLTGWTAGITKKLDHFIELANTTEINAYVIDIKDDDGLVSYESNVPEVREINAWTKKYDVDKVIKKLHDNGIPVIGRLVCFKDPYLSSKRPDLAIKHVNGGLWRDSRYKQTWLNPYNEESWPYLVAIAKEAVQKGFDEIQFDYVRFSDGKRSTMDFGNPTLEKYEAIDKFLAYARKEMPNVTISADVFGIIAESPADTEDIGQYLEYIGKEDVDYICPMVYPSHYAAGQIVNGVKFPKPDFDPYGVVYNSLAKAKNRISAVDGYKAKVRPYLQDFTAPWLGKGYYQQYGPEQVKQQIQAVYDAGYEEWILWDAKNTYSEAALKKE